MVRPLLIPLSLHNDVEAAIRESADKLKGIVKRSRERVNAGLPLAIKYMAPAVGADFKRGHKDFIISDKPGFTWGIATYVVPLCHPLSSGIYGRVGVVARFDPTGWRVFDTTDPWKESLYLRWLQLQPLYRDVLVTIHSDYSNHMLRNKFREDFEIDCVLFHPDERDSGGMYTAGNDVWMAVSDFDHVLAGGPPPGLRKRLRDGTSKKFTDARLVVVLEEEFKIDTPASTRSAILQLTSTRVPDATLIDGIRRNYAASPTGQMRISS